VVRALWAARLYGTPFLDQATLVAEVADNNSDRPRMRDLFKRNSPFGTLIAKSRDMRGPQGRKLLAE